MESGLNSGFWSGKRVLLTGHTGFKGTWLSLWLSKLGAKVTGFALGPDAEPTMFELVQADKDVATYTGDIRDQVAVATAFEQTRPEIVIHMAAQSLVGASYRDPVYTYSTNVLGTVNVLEGARHSPNLRVFINVTSDKCYENREWVWGYRETEPMGGRDPYSSSKGCAELVTAAYRRSFFNPADFSNHGVAVASVRAGNVIGGGDWAKERLIPDVVQAVAAGRPVVLRNPEAVRPWQHVLEPLSGYVLLARALWDRGAAFSDGWNFGPADHDTRPVEWLVDRFLEEWGEDVGWKTTDKARMHEAQYLKLDSSKAAQLLHWRPRWGIDVAVQKTAQWYRAWQAGDDMREATLAQIDAYERAGTGG